MRWIWFIVVSSWRLLCIASFRSLDLVCATAQLLFRSSVNCFMLSLVDSTFITPFTQLVISTFLVIVNVWFAVALSRIDQFSWNMHHIKAEYFMFHIVYVTWCFFLGHTTHFAKVRHIWGATHMRWTVATSSAALACRLSTNYYAHISSVFCSLPRQHVVCKKHCCMHYDCVVLKINYFELKTIMSFVRSSGTSSVHGIITSHRVVDKLFPFLSCLSTTPWLVFREGYEG